MKSNWLVVFEFLIFDGAAVAWGVWQLRSLRRDRKAAEAKEAAERAAASPDPAGHPEG